MKTIGIFNETGRELPELDKIHGLMEYATEYEKVDNVEFNIIIVDLETIHRLNKDYRNIDRPTDVISFALEDTHDIEYEDYRLLGDIYICIDKIYEQAESYGHSVLRELSFLSVHGLLHLLGYDHMVEADEKKMFGRQELILDGYGIKR